MDRPHRHRRWTGRKQRAHSSKLDEEKEEPSKTVTKEGSKEQHPPPSSKKTVHCNLDRFLESTCPSVRAQHLSKSCQWETCRKRQQAGSVENLPFFVLGDLWDSLDEWSAYGAGVPINLKGHDLVTQYYVPYLSALQLYTRSKKRPNMKCSVDDNDEASVPDCRRCLCGIYCHPADAAEACCGCFKFEKMSELALCCNPEKDEIIESSTQDRVWRQHLRYEYFESSPPYGRVPLSEKIAQLAVDFPELKTLRSVDLLPASWMSVAWYPIYRIPTGPTLRDLEACFLTFHSLSTSLQDGEPLGIVKPGRRPNACSVSVSSESDSVIRLEAFGLAHYKLRGSIWTSVGNPERRHAALLYRCAESWLEQLQVEHPDFDFFRSHNPSPSPS